MSNDWSRIRRITKALVYEEAAYSWIWVRECSFPILESSRSHYAWIYIHRELCMNAKICECQAPPSFNVITIFLKLDSILIFWGLLDAQKAPNPMNSVLLGIHDLNNNLGSTIMVIHSCVAKSQNPPKIHHSDVWSVERAHDLHNMSGISEEAVPVDWAHCEERSLGSFAAKSDFKFGQICSFAHLPAIKMQSVWNYPFWLCFAVLQGVPKKNYPSEIYLRTS